MTQKEKSGTGIGAKHVKKLKFTGILKFLKLILWRKRKENVENRC